MKIYHFYHIWADGMWKDAFDEHLLALRYSRLLEVISGFYIGLVGSKENREDAILHLKVNGIDFINLKDQGIDFLIVSQSDTGYEEVTLNKMIDMDLKDGYVLYAHTKGSFHNDDKNIAWRKNMTRSLVLDWINCVDLLEDYACVGDRYYVVKDQSRENISDVKMLPINEFMCSSKSKVDSKGIFLGNFWWSNLKYIKALSKIDSTDRFKSEFWIYDLKDVVKDMPFRVFNKRPLFERSRYE